MPPHHAVPFHFTHSFAIGKWKSWIWFGWCVYSLHCVSPFWTFATSVVDQLKPMSLNLQTTQSQLNLLQIWWLWWKWLCFAYKNSNPYNKISLIRLKKLTDYLFSWQLTVYLMKEIATCPCYMLFIQCCQRILPTVFIKRSSIQCDFFHKICSQFIAKKMKSVSFFILISDILLYVRI